jgi:hypothetical protein
VRELLAGVEVELGEERAKTAAALAQLKLEQEAATRERVYTGIGSGVVGALVGALLVFLLTGTK